MRCLLLIQISIFPQPSDTLNRVGLECDFSKALKVWIVYNVVLMFDKYPLFSEEEYCEISVAFNGLFVYVFEFRLGHADSNGKTF